MANPNWRSTFLRALIIVAAAFWIYSPVLNGTWLWDDDTDIVHNSLLQTLGGFWTIWFDPGHLSAYYPITFTVEWLEWHLWGNNTTGFHLVTLLFHILNALLVWRLLDRLNLHYAWLGGLLFAVHPMNVESVAWMVELKNTLSLTPFLLCLCAWIDYENHHRTSDYWRSWCLFLIAMLCKTTAMMFPLVILLYAWWRHGRVTWSSVKSSLPFFPISFVLCYATTLLQHHHSTLTSDIPLGGPLSRLALAGLTLSFYFSKFFVPLGLMPIYPQWKISPLTPFEFLPWLAVALIFYGLWIKRTSWGKHALLGLGFFFINLLPVLGFKLFSYMGFTWVFDHFIYIPMIGLIGLVIALLSKVESRFPASRRPICALSFAIVVLIFMLQSHSYAAIFFDQKTLWTYELIYNGKAWPAHDNIGNELFMEGDIEGAEAHYEISLYLNPYRFEAHNNLGMIFSLQGQYAAAIDEFEQSLKIKSDYAQAHVNMADTYVKMGRTREAEDHYKQAIQLDPNNAAARDSLSKLQIP
jgi:hypothetical protein